jgi:hypothetical protein
MSSNCNNCTIAPGHIMSFFTTVNKITHPQSSINQFQINPTQTNIKKTDTTPNGKFLKFIRKTQIN